MPIPKGYKHSPETITKMSLAKIGKVAGMFGKKHSEITKKKIRARITGMKQSPETIEKRFKNARGESHYNWQGGKSFEPYTLDWTHTLRQSIRERDRYTCQVYREPQGDRALSVHHIDYDKTNCNPENLISLCISCHLRTNFNRDKWKEYFNSAS